MALVTERDGLINHDTLSCYQWGSNERRRHKSAHPVEIASNSRPLRNAVFSTGRIIAIGVAQLAGMFPVPDTAD